MELSSFERDERRGRKTVTVRGVRDENGNEYRNANEAKAARKRMTNPLHGAQLDYTLFRVKVGGCNQWVEVSERIARTCQAMPYDQQIDMHKRMNAEGTEITKEAAETLIALLTRRFGL